MICLLKNVLLWIMSLRIFHNKEEVNSYSSRYFAVGKCHLVSMGNMF